VEELCHVRPSNATGWLSIEYTYKHPMFGNHKVTLKDHDVCEVRFPKGGTSILDEMGFSASHFWYNIFALLGLLVLFRILAYIVFIVRLNKLKKKVLKAANCSTQRIDPLPLN